MWPPKLIKGKGSEPGVVLGGGREFFFWRIHTHVLFWGHWYQCFRLRVMSPLGFKARVGPAYFTLWR